MKVVLDTNVIVSSFLSPTGTPAKIIDAWQKQKFDLLISENILKEYQKALNYKHIQTISKMAINDVEEIISDFRQFSQLVTPKEPINVIKRDPSDNKFLECAQEGNAHYIISGDIHLLEIENFEGIQILTPKAFLTLLQEESI